MRKFVIPMLLASALATPAFAGPREDRQAAREQARAERESAREERSAREDRAAAREERAARVERAPVAVAPVVVPRAAPADTPRVAPLRIRETQARVAAQPDQARMPARAAERRQAIEQRRQQRIEQRGAEPQGRAQPVTRQSERTPGRFDPRQRIEQSKERFEAIRRAHRSPPVVSPTPQPGTQPPPPPSTRPSPPPHWNHDWRKDRRYDWYDFRRRYGWLFNLGWYNDPFGWGYYPFSIGYRMWPSYYGSSFWINDPWQYRLPWAPPGTRWIRYYNDVILVDMWSGQVVDVIYDFFW